MCFYASANLSVRSKDSVPKVQRRRWRHQDEAKVKGMMEKELAVDKEK